MSRNANVYQSTSDLKHSSTFRLTPNIDSEVEKLDRRVAPRSPRLSLRYGLCVLAGLNSTEFAR